MFVLHTDMPANTCDTTQSDIPYKPCAQVAAAEQSVMQHLLADKSNLSLQCCSSLLGALRARLDDIHKLRLEGRSSHQEPINIRLCCQLI